jgi:hypothetical protein
LTLVDTNALLDVFTDDPVGPLVLNDVVYAELSVRFAAVETLESALAAAEVKVEPIPRPALFLAGRVCFGDTAAPGEPEPAYCRIS